MPGSHGVTAGDGHRYLRKTPESGARYEIIEHEAALVAEMFRRYADDGATIADLARWLTGQGIATRTGKHRWDRSVIWGMLRNPAYAGKAVFGKTQIVHEQPGLNRVARLQGRTTPRAVKTAARPREEWTEIPVLAIISSDTFDRVQQRLEDNKRFAARNAKVPSLLQGLAACSACGYYRASDPVTRQRTQRERALDKAATSITAMIGAYAEQLITIDELRTRMPDLRAREANLRGQLDALDAQAADRDAYLKLADDLDGFLAQLRGNAAAASTQERQRVLRLLVKDVLIGPEKITIRHRIPVRERTASGGGHENTDTEGDMRQGYLLRWGRAITA